MAHKHTQDERFILSAYEIGSRLGDVYMPLNKYEVGKAVGINPKGVDAISKLLIQANFIKKVQGDDAMIYLTKNGEQLAFRLLEE